MLKMEDFSGIINWENFFRQSEKFKKTKPFKFAFVENFFVEEFYEKLYKTYPNLNEFSDGSDLSKSQLYRNWEKYGENEIVGNENDSNLSKEWNKFKRYTETEEFIGNFRKFVGLSVNKLKFFHFVSYRKGGFQLPHIHNVGPSTLVIFFYFSKNWKEGDPGGTYMASEEDESSIIFEPYNLNNSMAIFQDGPNAAHGVRYITKDVERRAAGVVLEEYSPKTGWSGGDPQKIIRDRKKI